MDTSLQEKRKKQIIEAAMEVFGKDGFHGGTVENIAIAAGLGKGTIYEYFSSKQEIFEEMILSFAKDYLETLEKSFNQDISFKNKLIKFIELEKEFLDSNFTLIEQSISGLKELSCEFVENLKQMHLNSFNLFTKLVDQAKKSQEIDDRLDSTTVALLIMSTISRVADNAKLLGLIDEINAEKIINILFDGIKKEL